MNAYKIRRKHASSPENFQYDGYLIHYGISGQKWGVRRFQNENGTLTEEGRARYLDSYKKAEKKAEEDLARAEKQLADIMANGWDAKRAFTKGFKAQSEKNLGRKLDDDDLQMFINTFKQDVADAKTNLKAVKQSRAFIENNKDVTIDDIIAESEKIDKKNKTQQKKEAEKLADELGLERKKRETKSVKIPEYTKSIEKELKKNYSEAEMKSIVKDITSDLKRETGEDFSTWKINGKPFNEMPIDQQFYVMFAMVYGLSG